MQSPTQPPDQLGTSIMLAAQPPSPPAADTDATAAEECDDVASVRLCDLPPEVLQLILRHLECAEDVARAVAACRALWAVAGSAPPLALAVSLPLAAPPDAPPCRALPSALAARAWLRGVASLELSGAFLAEDEVVAACTLLPRLRHLALSGCQKVAGDALLAALPRAARLESLSIHACWSLRAAAATALLAACLSGACPLRALLLGDATLDMAELLPPPEQVDDDAAAAPKAASSAAACRLQLLGLPSCTLSAAEHAPAALGRAHDLRVLCLSGASLSNSPEDAAVAPASDDPDALPPPPPPPLPPKPPVEALRAALPRLRVLELTQARWLRDNEPPVGLMPWRSPRTMAADDADVAALEIWDLARVSCASTLAALGARRLHGRLSGGCGQVCAAELAAAVAAAAGAPGGARRGTPLHAAAARGDAAHAAALLQLGARADARDVTGATPLFVAAEAGHAACCATLLAHGAALDVRTTAGEGPAYIAALKGRDDAAAVLLAAASARGLDSGALANDDGWAPLHAAAVAGRARMLALCAGAPCAGALDGTNRFGQTALHIAARRGSEELVGLLLAAGAAAGVRDERGAAPADVAAKHGHAALAATLRAAPQGRRKQKQPVGPTRAERRRAREDAAAAALAAQAAHAATHATAALNICDADAPQQQPAADAPV